MCVKIYIYTLYGGVLKWWYPKSSKSLNHFSIETYADLGIHILRNPLAADSASACAHAARVGKGLKTQRLPGRLLLCGGCLDP